MPKLRIVAIHGWGFESSFWRPLEEAFTQSAAEATFYSLNLGFIGERAVSLEPETSSDQAVWVGLGHSLGFSWLVENLPKLPRFRALMAVSGFCRFTAEGGAGVPPRVLSRMRSKLVADPEQVVKDFRRRAGAGESCSGLGSLNPGMLAQGLQQLEEWDLSSLVGGLKIPLLVLAARDDPIVSLEMLPESPDCTVVVSRSGGHLLPRRRSKWCAEEIMKFLDRKGVL